MTEEQKRILELTQTLAMCLGALRVVAVTEGKVHPEEIKRLIAAVQHTLRMDEPVTLPAQPQAVTS